MVIMSVKRIYYSGRQQGEVLMKANSTRSFQNTWSLHCSSGITKPKICLIYSFFRFIILLEYFIIDQQCFIIPLQ